ncbi:optineurin isoform X2 [Clupea harengus]|uniref:Optineurin n=1 Tax=Clupea harengus TaxID=7950 RepID=A0A6P8GSW0_CLUHA|nr:optineurin isoform X2 [Clupea harengus]
MASSTPLVNGDRGSPTEAGVGSLEEALEQMNILIMENRELKEALRQTNSSMKERFEDLSLWREKQRDEREFLEGRLEEARQRVLALSTENEGLKNQVPGQAEAGEIEVLRVQLGRVQAEKNDLVALNSELQLKMGQESPDNSFIEIRIAEGQLNVTKDIPSTQEELTASCMTRLKSEEQTVSQLLQSLRSETKRVETLETELRAARERLNELERQRQKNSEISTQTSLPLPLMDQQDADKDKQSSADKSATEVENLKAQVKTLVKELQEPQSKLDEAEKMKKNLQDRCREMEQELASLRTQLGERQQVQTENERLKLQMESLQAHNKLEQKKAQEEKNNLAQLKDAYTKLFEDYNEMKEERKRREASMSREEANGIQMRLVAAEKALATKQQKIDDMKQELFQKEKDLDTVSVFKAQAEVYSADFYAERAAREAIHAEKERLAAQLEFVKKQKNQLEEEMDSFGRQSLGEMQRRHVPRGATPQGGARGTALRKGVEMNIPEHACPKCNEILPDLDSLQIHIMDCII